jgi:hypothetical protein
MSSPPGSLAALLYVVVGLALVCRKELGMIPLARTHLFQFLDGLGPSLEPGAELLFALGSSAIMGFSMWLPWYRKQRLALVADRSLPPAAEGASG